MTAQYGGGYGITVEGQSPSPASTLIFTDLSGSTTLQSGHQVLIQAHDGEYLSAQCGGGYGSAGDYCGSIVANRTTPSGWETFTVYKIGGSSGATITHGDLVAITSYNGQICSADINGGGPGSVMTCLRGAIGGWETFIFKDPVRVAAPSTYTIQSQSGYYFSANSGGGSNITIDRTQPGGWEKFTINNNYSSTLNNGDQVSIRSLSGQALSAVCGGMGSLQSDCGTVLANRDVISTWETFYLVKTGVSPGNRILSGDSFLIRSSNGSYCTAEVNGGGPGSYFICNRTAPGGWETFMLKVAAESGSVAPAIPGFDLVFNDEFNDPQLNTSKWWTRYINGGDHPEIVMEGTTNFLNGGQERFGEFHNHIMTGDSIRLTAYGTAGTTNWEHPSGMIRSKVTFKYGYFEARLKVPSTNGTFPAFWLNPDSTPTGAYGGWPPELDFMEHVNNSQYPDEQSQVHMGYQKSVANATGVFSYLAPNYLGVDSGSAYLQLSSPMAGGFHTIGGLWDTDDTITYFYDGVEVFKRTYNWKVDSGGEAPYAHVLLDLAVGGGWAGPPDLTWDTNPQALEVDYIRVYQRTGQHATGVSFIGQSYCPDDGSC